LSFAPATENELADVIASASAPFAVEGLGSKRSFGHRVDAQVLSLAKFSGVTLYEPEELVLEAGAATPLDEIETLLDARQQRLAFEPPDYARIMRSNSRGTIGSVMACNLSGPRRLTAGAARDHILGVRGVSGRGEVFKAGGRVVKNVTGYDVAKLMCGSFGTLAALTTITVKVLPKPETDETLLVRVDDVHEAGRVMRAAMQSPFDVSCAAYVPERGVGLRLEGIPVSVQARKESLIKLLQISPDVLREDESRRFWIVVRDVEILDIDHCLWRISVAPSEGPAIAGRLARETNGTYVLDWSGGLMWLATAEPNAEKIRSAIGSGHATLVSAHEGMRSTVDVFQPQPAALSAVAQRMKHAFDPKGLLSPFRMSKEF
jgi:glycolate oxidase FAD binding subunit